MTYSLYNVGGNSWNVDYEYDDTNHVRNSVTTSDGVASETNYDYLGRPISRIMGESEDVTMSYTYEEGAAPNSVTNLVSCFSATGQTAKEYTYDEAGLITEISSTNKTIEYEYDKKSQLISAYDVTNSRQMIYRYDDGGNITSKSYCINDENTFAILWTKQYTYDSNFIRCQVQVNIL